MQREDIQVGEEYAFRANRTYGLPERVRVTGEAEKVAKGRTDVFVFPIEGARYAKTAEARELRGTWAAHEAEEKVRRDMDKRTRAEREAKIDAWGDLPKQFEKHLGQWSARLDYGNLQLSVKDPEIARRMLAALES